MLISKLQRLRTKPTNRLSRSWFLESVAPSTRSISPSEPLDTAKMFACCACRMPDATVRARVDSNRRHSIACCSSSLLTGNVLVIAGQPICAGGGLAVLGGQGGWAGAEKRSAVRETAGQQGQHPAPLPAIRRHASQRSVSSEACRVLPCAQCGGSERRQGCGSKQEQPREDAGQGRPRAQRENCVGVEV
eukprot:968501-Rhodomonas_salina.2